MREMREELALMRGKLNYLEQWRTSLLDQVAAMESVLNEADSLEILRGDEGGESGGGAGKDKPLARPIQVLEVAAKVLHCRLSDLEKPQKGHDASSTHITQAQRRLVMALVVRWCGLTAAEAAEFFSYESHTSVTSAIRFAQPLMKLPDAIAINRALEARFVRLSS